MEKRYFCKECDHIYRIEFNDFMRKCVDVRKGLCIECEKMNEHRRKENESTRFKKAVQRR